MEIAVAILVGAVIPALGWAMEHRLQAARTAEQRLHDARRALYRDILSPYIRSFQAMGTASKSPEALLMARAANEQLTSLDHRMKVFDLMMVGSDEVIRAFNHFARFKIEVDTGTLIEAPGDLLWLWADLVLAIRKDLGEPKTKIPASAMIEAWVSDMENVFPGYHSDLSEHLSLRKSQSMRNGVKALYRTA